MRIRLALIVIAAAGIAPLLHAADPTAIWNSLAKPAFDADAYGRVTNAKLVRDRVDITLAEGAIQFSQPVEGLSFAAAFRGKGRLVVLPPNPREAQQINLFLKQEQLDMEFTEAVFMLSSDVKQEMGGQVQWEKSADASLAALYADRNEERENVGAEMMARIFKSLLSADRQRTAMFACDLKTTSKGWVHVRFDSLEPEDVTVGRWTNWGGVTRFDTWLSFPAGGRSAAAAYQDPLAKEDFAIQAYKLSTGVTNSAEMTATAQVKLNYRVAGERVLLFTLDAKLRVDSVKDSAGNALLFFQPRDPKDRNQSYGEYLAVVLPQPTQAGASDTLEFHYAGKRVVRKVGSGGFFCQSFGWYPTRPNSFAVRADFEMTFRSPKKYLLVATGNKTDETRDGDLLVTNWKSDIPLAVAGFAYGDYKVATSKAGNTNVEIYANKEPDDFMKSILNQTSGGIGGEGPSSAPLGTLSPAALVPTMVAEITNTLRLFETYFGPYPYKQIAVTNIPYSYGQGWPGLLYLSALTFMDSTQRNALGIRDHVGISDFFRAHESSHQWWGHRVGWKSYHDQWLSEGFAQFSGNLYVAFRKNQKEYLGRLRLDREDLFGRDLHNRTYESLGPIWMGNRLSSSDAPGGYSNVIYNKGGWVLHMLRMMMFDPGNRNPDQAFIAMMRDFTKTFDNKAASTEDFKTIAEKHMIPGMDLDGNGKLDWFFNQYVYGTGMARYDLSYTAEDAGGGKWKTKVSIRQSKAPSRWKDLLPIYAKTGGKTLRLGMYGMQQAQSSFDILLPFKPESVTLNEWEDTLAEIHQ